MRAQTTTGREPRQTADRQKTSREEEKAYRDALGRIRIRSRGSLEQDAG